jgi:hypothetical protein
MASRIPHFRSLLAAVVCACALASWPSPSPAAPSTPLSQEEIQSAWEGPGRELQETIRQIERGIPLGDAQPLLNQMQPEWLLQRAMENGGDEGLRKAFAEGTRASWKQRSLVADTLGTHFRFIRIHTMAGRAGLLFRANGENGALNYYLYPMAKDASGKAWIDDVYVVGLGEFVSQSLGRGYRMLVNSSGTGPEAAVATEYLENIGLIMKIAAALRESNYPSVIDLSKKLPERLQVDRSLLLLRVEAAEHLGPLVRRAVLTEWCHTYTDPMALPLKLVDFYSGEGRFDQAEAVLKALDETIGGDTALNLRLGEMRLLQRRATELAAAAASKSQPASSSSSPFTPTGM